MLPITFPKEKTASDRSQWLETCRREINDDVTAQATKRPQFGLFFLLGMTTLACIVFGIVSAFGATASDLLFGLSAIFLSTFITAIICEIFAWTSGNR